MPAGRVRHRSGLDGFIRGDVPQAFPVLLVDRDQISVGVSVKQGAAGRAQYAGHRLPAKSSVQVVTEYLGVRSAPVSIPVAASAPSIFTANGSGTGQGAILNEGGSVNSPANPARGGSIVVIYATCEGQTNPAGLDEKIASGTLPAPSFQ